MRKFSFWEKDKDYVIDEIVIGFIIDDDLKIKSCKCKYIDDSYVNHHNGNIENHYSWRIENNNGGFSREKHWYHTYKEALVDRNEKINNRLKDIEKEIEFINSLQDHKYPLALVRIK